MLFLEIGEELGFFVKVFVWFVCCRSFLWLRNWLGVVIVIIEERLVGGFSVGRGIVFFFEEFEVYSLSSN